MFSVRLKELREERGLSQSELAKAIGYTQSHIAKWENNAHEPKASALVSLAKFFNVTAGYLIGLED